MSRWSRSRQRCLGVRENAWAETGRGMMRRMVGRRLLDRCFPFVGFTLRINESGSSGPSHGLDSRPSTFRQPDPWYTAIAVRACGAHGRLTSSDALNGDAGTGEGLLETRLRRHTRTSPHTRERSVWSPQERRTHSLEPSGAGWLECSVEIDAIREGRVGATERTGSPDGKEGKSCGRDASRGRIV